MTYEQYLNEWVELYRRGEIPSNEVPMTEETLLETLELMKEELNPAARKVKWALGDRFSCPYCDNDYALGDFCSACGKPIDWTDLD